MKTGMAPPTADAGRPAASPRSRASRLRRAAWTIIGLTLAALAVWTVSGKTHELTGATAYLGHIRWPWIIVHWPA